MKKMILIANLYPSNDFPHYGTFIKKFHCIAENYFDVTLIVLTKEKSRTKKIIKYIYFYINIICKVLCHNNSIIYVHYISHSALPLLFCKIFKKYPLYINVHGSDVFPEGKNEFLQKYVYKIINKADKIVVPSEYFAKEVSKKYNISENIIKTFPSGGVNSKCFNVLNRQSLLKKYNFSNDCIYIGYVSRLDEGKGYNTFLKSLVLFKKINRTENIKVIMVGSGKYEEEVKTFIIENKLSDIIIRYPLLDQSQLAEIYNILDWFVFPTERKGESLGLVGLEAMACGTPIIASNYAGPATYVDNKKNGILFNMGDSKDLAEKLKLVCSFTENEYQSYRSEAVISSEKYLDRNLGDYFKYIFK